MLMMQGVTLIHPVNVSLPDPFSTVTVTCGAPGSATSTLPVLLGGPWVTKHFLVTVKGHGGWALLLC